MMRPLTKIIGLEHMNIHLKNRWGYITAVMFGSQNGNGQYHKNCYTKQKLRNIFKKLNFKIIKEEVYLWPRGGGDDRTLRFVTEKES